MLYKVNILDKKKNKIGTKYVNTDKEVREMLDGVFGKHLYISPTKILLADGKELNVYPLEVINF